MYDRRLVVKLNTADGDEEDQIDKKTLEISQADDEVYKDMVELGDELPDNSPRFVLLSYPLTLVRRETHFALGSKS